MAKNLEHQFSMLVREIRKEYVGNGPKEITTKFIGSWAVSEMRGNLTNVEKFMITSAQGEDMVHETRTRFVKEIYKKPEVQLKFENLMDARVIRLFSDINIKEDIAMTVFVFDRPIEGKQGKQL
ncbi:MULTISPECIES: DUF2294 domain-containing protein [Bacillaceae]|uniref:Na+-translocating membrane potential-generating system MpsC domain-containing protein n=3 Tax=Bacillus infantis TaxID=324767 RepID=U5LHM1_9BACI|nr:MULTISPECIES: DUF2294 domain-containing protein [Bacillus]OXT17808.1 hypothetical protein B9K06_07975 [Bacillus sp. OG2]AGX06980.1 hypothetical protein N288_25750 [Bacillus infantis NRRL B-14911]EAR67904.1 hypothetical protein B14911_14107 [Bacillus sp. NRRL B-14911]MCA1033058.1 DUF2294 domain-containing protein [Bacillus infantis]MCK6206431.1 DUF2294 domain-containing protein [Bacillus infantis]